MGNIRVVNETTLTVEKKPLVLVLPYLRSVSLQIIIIIIIIVVVVVIIISLFKVDRIVKYW